MAAMQISDLDPSAALVERLVRLFDLTANPRMVCVAARRDHGLTSIDIDRPTLALVLRGTKAVQCGTRAGQLASGDLLAMAAGTRLDVVNRPDPAEGRYLSLNVPLCDDVLTTARLMWPHPPQPQGMGFVGVPANTLTPELCALGDAIEADSEPQARLAVLNLLAKLAQQGCSDLLLPPAPSLSARVRQQVAQAPARAWRSADFEQALGVSGATLRRRLAAEGTALREVVAQARLACALDLLYTTRWPVKTVADRVGYRSVESFSRRFRARYGLDASAIGNTVDPA